MTSSHSFATEKENLDEYVSALPPAQGIVKNWKFEWKNQNYTFYVNTLKFTKIK